MNGYQESYHLSFEEILVILALSGKTSLFGLQPSQPLDLSQELVWNTCCKLVRAGIMTQVDEKFRLRRDFYEVMHPIFTAGTTWVLTPGAEHCPQTVFYLGENAVTAVQKMNYGGYSLTPLLFSELPQYIQDLLPLRVYCEELFAQEEVCDCPSVDAPWEALRQDAGFLLEISDAATGSRLSWARCTEVDFVPWLQWTEQGIVCCEVMTQGGLEALLRKLGKEE